MGVILDFIIGILVTLSVLLAGLITTYGVLAATAFINPFAAVMMPILMTMIMVYVILFLSISIPSLIIVVFCMDYMKMQSKAFPSLPTCFDKDTNIKVNDTVFIPVCNIKPGDILYDNNRVESILKCSMTKHQKMFYLNNDLITSFHKVYYHTNGGEWIYVKDHPNSVEMYDYHPENVYCLNTSHKTIRTHINEYMDWDEVERVTIDDSIQINGYVWDTSIIMKNGECNFISNIKLGDEIFPNGIVLGIVIIDKGESEKFKGECLWDEDIDNYKELYNFHLITTSSIFYLQNNEQYVNDYSNLKNYYL